MFLSHLLFVFLSLLTTLVSCGRFEAIKFNGKRQAGTSGQIPPAPCPQTNGYPGLGPCVWGKENTWNNCNWTIAGTNTFDSAYCKALTPSGVNLLAPPYNNTVAVAWFNYTNLIAQEQQAVGPSIPLDKMYHWSISWGSNAPIESIKVVVARDYQTKNYDTITTQFPRNASGIFAFDLSNSGYMHFEITWTWGHPSGSFVVWQQPKDLKSVSQYASYRSTTTVSSTSKALVSTQYTVSSINGSPIISIGLNTSYATSSPGATCTAPWTSMVVNSGNAYNPYGALFNTLGGLVSATPSMGAASAVTSVITGCYGFQLPSGGGSASSGTPGSTAVATDPNPSTLSNPFEGQIQSYSRPATVYVPLQNNTMTNSSTMSSPTSTMMPTSSGSSISQIFVNAASASMTSKTNSSSIVSTSSHSSSSSSVRSSSSSSVRSSSTSSVRSSSMSSQSSSAPPSSSPSSSSAPSASPTSELGSGAGVLSPENNSPISSSIPPTTAPTDLSLTAYAGSALLTNTSGAYTPPYTPSGAASIIVALNNTTTAPIYTPPSIITPQSNPSSLAPSIPPYSPYSSIYVPPLQTTIPSVILPASSVIIPASSVDLAAASSAATAQSTSDGSGGAYQIPLWAQCGFTAGEVCAGGGQCICKDPTYSQCRTQVDGSWNPPGMTWQCTQPGQNPGAPAPVNTQQGSGASATSAAAVPVLPLWWACGNYNVGTCVQGSQCICQNEYYSQCRIPIDGSWAGGPDWKCTQPGQQVAVS